MSALGMNDRKSISASTCTASTRSSAAVTPTNFPQAYSAGRSGVESRTSSARASSSRITLNPAAAATKKV